MDSSLSELNLKDILPALASLAAPGVCVCCGGRTDGEPLCPRCLADLPLSRYWQYEENPMAEAYNARLSDWLEAYEPYAHAASLLLYVPLVGGGDLAEAARNEAPDCDQPEDESAARNEAPDYNQPEDESGNQQQRISQGYSAIPQELKYHRGFRLGRRMGLLLGEKLKESPFFADVDAVVPVPLHWTRRLKRGYNQAEVLARAVAEALGVPCETRLLRRAKRTSTQTRLSVEGKSANVRGAFRARKPKPARNLQSTQHPQSAAHPKLSPFRHILLIDDVFTTGSTLSECHRALRAVYPYPDVRISVATLSSVK